MLPHWSSSDVFQIINRWHYSKKKTPGVHRLIILQRWCWKRLGSCSLNKNHFGLEHEIIIYLLTVLLQDHEEVYELYILLHLQVEQMRYKAGPFLCYASFSPCSLCSIFFFIACTFTSVHRHIAVSLPLKITVIPDITCPLPQSFWCLSDCWKYLQAQHGSMSHPRLLGEQREKKKKYGKKKTSSSAGGSETARTFRLLLKELTQIAVGRIERTQHWKLEQCFKKTNKKNNAAAQCVAMRQTLHTPPQRETMNQGRSLVGKSSRRETDRQGNGAKRREELTGSDGGARWEKGRAAQERRQ